MAVRGTRWPTMMQRKPGGRQSQSPSSSSVQPIFIGRRISLSPPPSLIVGAAARGGLATPPSEPVDVQPLVAAVQHQH
ncbi:Os12g0161200 [Oryza sativa Japonica Group]|uniref:Os12g0161200 protein n=1 Tax=Oryza sativa subsp. japonica TaxID=39947 RepID=A0A0P0Y750_ORYSJ|nr:Os12g0161200 [Oryza sativa Japonica Group]